MDGNEGTFWHGSTFSTHNHAGLILSGCGGGGSFEASSLSIESNDEILLYSNPTDGRVTLRYYLEVGQQAMLLFSDVAGRTLTKITLMGESRWAKSPTCRRNLMALIG